MPSWTPDYVIGGNGNNSVQVVRGVVGLIGVNPSSSNPGAGEIDTLIGGRAGDETFDNSPDIFVLGDANNVYYQGGGATDYAVIREFNTNPQISQPDVLQLKGTASDYSVAGNELFYRGDQIAIFDGLSQSDLSLALANANFL